MVVRTKRAYDTPLRTDGSRMLVERLWPRGVSKAQLAVDKWLKDVAPSAELRKWFGHDPRNWRGFRLRYFRELDTKPESWRPILATAERGTVTLVYSARDVHHNSAIALQQYLGRQVKATQRQRSSRLMRSRAAKEAHRVTEAD